MSTITSISDKVLELSFTLDGERFATVRFDVNDTLRPCPATIDSVYREWYLVLLDLNNIDKFNKAVIRAKKMIECLRSQSIEERREYLAILMTSNLNDSQHGDTFVQILVDALYKVISCYWAETV